MKNLHWGIHIKSNIHFGEMNFTWELKFDLLKLYLYAFVKVKY